jgi:hypothetical protein
VGVHWSNDRNIGRGGSSEIQPEVTEVIASGTPRDFSSHPDYSRWW